MMVKNRIDFKQDIFNCWHVVDDIKHLTEMISDRGASTDDITNVLIGMQTLYDDRFRELVASFEYLIASEIDDALGFSRDINDERRHEYR
jgi:uncharacterized protein YPO0396